MKTTLKTIFAATFVCFVIWSCTKDESSTPAQDETQQELTTTTKAYYPPWVYVMDVRFSRDTCATGPGVCFQNGDGDIWDYMFVGNGGSTIEEVKANLDRFDINDDDEDDIGVVAYQREGDMLRVVFSRSLEEENFVLSSDKELEQGLAAALGKASITIPKGSYRVNKGTFEHGEALVPIVSRDIALDTHPVYGRVSKEAYPMGGGASFEDFLFAFGIEERDIESYQMTEAKFTGTALAQHLIDGEVVYVWHKYEGEPVTVFEAVLTDGRPISSQRIHFCGNGFGGYNSFDFFWAFIDHGCWWC